MPLGRVVVVMLRVWDFVAMTALYATREVPPPQPVTVTVKESVPAVVGVPVRFSEVVVLGVFAVMPAGRAPDEMDHL